jgi:hypothetical protein
MSNRPNFVIFVPEQLRADAVSVFGNPLVDTRNLDARAACRTRFSQAYVEEEPQLERAGFPYGLKVAQLCVIWSRPTRGGSTSHPSCTHAAITSRKSSIRRGSQRAPWSKFACATPPTSSRSKRILVFRRSTRQHPVRDLSARRS